VWKVGDGSFAMKLPRQGEGVAVSWAQRAQRPLFLSFSASNGAPRPTVWNADDLSHPLATIGPAESAAPGQWEIGATGALWTPFGADLSPDGRQVVTTEMVQRFRIWNVASTRGPVAVSEPWKRYVPAPVQSASEPTRCCSG
jgi:hypothetical protein